MSFSHHFEDKTLSLDLTEMIVPIEVCAVKFHLGI